MGNARKYRWTEELLRELRDAYAGDRRHLTRGLNRLEARTGWPRQALTVQAVRMGIACSGTYRRWTAEDDAYLLERLGTVSTKAIARGLGRTREAVEGRAVRLRVSRRMREGYNVSDLAASFGAHHTTVARWMERGLFGKVHQSTGLRVTEANVLRFIREHAAEYDLRRVDQVWFKGMVFREGSCLD